MKFNIWATGSNRKAFKQALSITKVKILYARITLTRVTTAYCIFTVVTCVILSVLHGITFRDNSDAINAIGSILGASRRESGLAVIIDGHLQQCDSVPDQSGTNCQEILVFGTTNDAKRRRDLAAHARSDVRERVERDFEVEGDALPPVADDDDDSESDSSDSDSDSDSESDSDLEDEEESDDEEEEVKTDTGVKTKEHEGHNGVNNQADTSGTIPPVVVDGTTTGSGDSTNSNSQTNTSPADEDISLSSTVGLSKSCVVSLRWLDDTIHDAQREDIVTFLFQMWLFVLAFVTILNESIPHLVAGLLGHVMGTAWSAYRITSMESLKNFYRNAIVPEACDGQDFLGKWWEVRVSHAIPVAVMNGVSLIVLCGLSYKLFSVYANESFSRVGASAKIHRMYKTVLVFSVCLQLSGFFSIASTAMWIDRISHGVMMQLAQHSKLYLAAFTVFLVLTFPWFYLGWVCVRKECRIRFMIFIGVALFLLTISSVMFASPLYIYNFMNWRLFGVMSVTAYVLSVVTTALAIVCRLNFGKGLAHYLQVSEALEGMDFTPVVFAKGEYPSDDTEKYGADAKFGSADLMKPMAPVTLPPASLAVPKKQKQRGSSIYSDPSGSAVYLSSTPPLLSDLAPAPDSLARAATKRGAVPYPAVRDIVPASHGKERKGKDEVRVASPVESLQSSLSSYPSSTFSLGSGHRKVGLPSNPRGNKPPRM